MTAFDPYHRWLGIQPHEQPPHQYRLLGLNLYESNADVIDEAADRQMACVRMKQGGQYAAQAAKLLNELTVARICLLDPSKKRAYDSALREQLAAARPAQPAAAAKALPVARPLAAAARAPVAATSATPAAPQLIFDKQSAPKPSVQAKPIAPPWMMYCAAAGAAAIALIVLVIIWNSAGNQSDDVTKVASAAPAAEKPNPPVITTSAQANKTKPANPPAPIQRPPAPVKNPPPQIVVPKPPKPTNSTNNIASPLPTVAPAPPFETRTKIPEPKTPAPTTSDPFAPPTVAAQPKPETQVAQVVPALRGPVPAVEVHRFTHHKAAVTKLAVSVDGTFLATAGADKLVYVFNTGTFQMVTVLGPHPGEPTGLSFVKDNSVLVSMLANQSSRNNVAWWDWQNKTGLKKKFSDADISLYAIQASPTGAKFAVTMGDSNARTYNLNDNGRQGLVSPRETLKCLCVAFSPTGRYLRMASGGGSVRWQVEGQLGPAGHINPESEAVTTCMAYLPDGTQFVSSHDDGQLRIWREEEGTIVARIAAHKGEASSVAVSSDGKFLVSGGHDQSVRVWNIATQELVKECAGHSGAVTSVVFLKSDVVASSSQDGTVRIWSLKDNAVAAAPSQPAPVRPAVPAPQPSLPNETPAPAPAAVKALPPPEESQVTEAIELMRKVFKDEYAAKKPADKLKLSKQLLDQARDEKGEPAERFAMLQEALRLAIEVGDIDASLLAARSSAASFRQPADFEVQVVKRLLDSVSGVPENAGLASAALDWADQKRAKENFDEADQLAKLASRAATKGRSTPLQKNARELGDRIRREQERFLAYQLAVKVLKDQPDDAAANLTIGRYFCFTRGEWPTGIKHLALGSGSLKVVADKELAAEKLKQESKKPLETSDLIALAEQWQSAAADLPESERQHALAAAIYWYEQALSSLTGLQKLKVEQAMKKIAPTGIQRK